MSAIVKTNSVQKVLLNSAFKIQKFKILSLSSQRRRAS